MKKAFGSYQRLARGFFSCSSLWLGDGHLLYIKGSGLLLPFTEEYRRFEFDRIQSLAVMKTRTGAVVSAITVSIAALAGMASTVAVRAAMENESEAQVGFGILAGLTLLTGGLALVILIVNFSRGPTCVTVVRTPVGAERIRPLRRLRRALRVVGQLAPLVDEAQRGARSPESPLPAPSATAMSPPAPAPPGG